MAHYLVTGGCGFIGSHLCEFLLQHGHKVRVLDNLSTGKKENISCDQIELQIGDITNAQDVKQAFIGIDGCFHLAAIASVQKSNEEWLATHQTNLTGTIRIFEEATRQLKKTPILYVSSAAIYGDNTHLPLGEDCLPRPLTAYGADKLACEHHGRVASLVHHIPTIGFRLFNVYGTRQDPSSPYSGVISIFMDKIARQEPVIIYGDGHQTRDFVYVKDVVRYFAKAMQHLGQDQSPDHGVFNICRGEKISIQTLLETLSDIAGFHPKITYADARPGDIKHSQGSYLKLLQKFSFKPETDLKDGLRETYSFFHQPHQKNSALGYSR
ncbi:MAG: SDR family NAD(P)-dependent oxidoreductase [Alphaproteobacteria bacterium]|nr:SDR family NAD(P)-dependent oxidoreductase [Alphaproteobacteria bacterium]